jgi:hypothetical protein
MDYIFYASILFSNSKKKNDNVFNGIGKNPLVRLLMYFYHKYAFTRNLHQFPFLHESEKP